MTATRPFDPTRPVQTRDGRPARILCTDFKSPNEVRRIVAALLTETGHEEIVYRSRDGRRFEGAENGGDLVNVPVGYEHERWVNLWLHPAGDVRTGKKTTWLSEAAAKACASRLTEGFTSDWNGGGKYVATVPLRWTE